MDKTKAFFIIVPSIVVLGIVTIVAANIYTIYDDATYDRITEKEKPVVVEEEVADIIKPDCMELWSCGDWSDCSDENTQTRECVDENECGTQTIAPVLTKNCIYEAPCEESWVCTEWSICDNDTQSRECTDENTCGTTEAKPEMTQECTSGETAPVDEVTANTPVAQKDCGISNSFAGDTPLNDIDFEKDAAFVCLGTNILTDCTPSSMTVNNGDGTPTKIEVSNNETTDECMIRMEHGPNFSENSTDFYNNKIDSTLKNPATPGTYAGKIFIVSSANI